MREPGVARVLPVRERLQDLLCHLWERAVQPPRLLCLRGPRIELQIESGVSEIAIYSLTQWDKKGEAEWPLLIENWESVRVPCGYIWLLSFPAYNTRDLPRERSVLAEVLMDGHRREPARMSITRYVLEVIHPRRHRKSEPGSGDR